MWHFWHCVCDISVAFLTWHLIHHRLTGTLTGYILYLLCIVSICYLLCTHSACYAVYRGRRKVTGEGGEWGERKRVREEEEIEIRDTRVIVRGYEESERRGAKWEERRGGGKRLRGGGRRLRRKEESEREGEGWEKEAVRVRLKEESDKGGKGWYEMRMVAGEDKDKRGGGGSEEKRRREEEEGGETRCVLN